MSTELNTKHPLRGLALALFAFALGGCVVAPSDPYYYGEESILVTPPARVEYRGYPPAAGYFWIDGYWTQVGRRHDWVPGRWAPPRYRTTEIIRERTVDHRRDHRWDGNRDRSRGGDDRRGRDGVRDRDRGQDWDRSRERIGPRTPPPQAAPQVVPQQRRERAQVPGMERVREGSGDRSGRNRDSIRSRDGGDDRGGRRAGRDRSDERRIDDGGRRGGERRGDDRRGDSRRGDDRR